MRSVTKITAMSALALLAVTVKPVPAIARSPRAETSATSGVGPESDYPLVVGDAFTVDGKTYVPSDTMNYDAVGYAEAGEGVDVVTGAHRTLPLPSYVEVTSLTSGKTILVRLTKRGPMAGANLVALSSGAWAQLRLGQGAKAPVRVRRVNPPESERAMLRLGEHAPDRMETPPGLLGVLKRKLGEASVAVLSETARGAAASAMAPPVVVKPDGAKIAVVDATTSQRIASRAPNSPPKAMTAGMTKPGVAATAPVLPKLVAETAKVRPDKPAAVAPTQTAPLAGKGGQSVQIGAFSSEVRATAAAAKIGGRVSQSGKVWRVRLGPFTNRASADRGLAKARAAGYLDARLVREP